MEPLSKHTELAPEGIVGLFSSLDSHGIKLCGLIIVASIYFMEEEYSSKNLAHQVHMPIKDLIKYNDPEILKSMKECMIEKGYLHKDDFTIGLFATDSDDFMILSAAFRTEEMAILFKLLWS